MGLSRESGGRTQLLIAGGWAAVRWCREDQPLQRSLAQKDERIADLLEQINVLDRTLAAERERHHASLESLHADLANRVRVCVCFLT